MRPILTPVRCVVALVVVAGAILASCSSSNGDDGGAGSVPGPGRVGVVASFYPLAEAASLVGGDAVEMTNLTPPGVEPHDLELTPDDLEAIGRADVVLYLGDGFQPAVQDAAAQTEGHAIDLLDGEQLLSAPEGEEELEADPHVWLDPGRYSAIVARVADALTQVDPHHASAFRSRAEAEQAELADLDHEFRDGLADCRSRLLVTNHAAFGYLAAAYGLEQEPISGIAPEAEPDPARLAELHDLVDREGVTTIFTEELVSPDVAETLASEASVATATLSPLEGLTDPELERGEDYASIMRANLETLRDALGCH